MKLSQWRPAFLGWLQQQIVVDEWLMDVPVTTNQTTAFLPPLKDVRYKLDTAQVLGQGTQELFVIKRLPGTLAYKDIPLHTMEGLYQTLAVRLVANWGDILKPNGLTDLRWSSVSDPVSLQSPKEVQDWLVQLKWVFDIYFNAELEVGQPTKPIDIKEVRGTLWRSKLTPEDFSDSLLDFTFVVGGEDVT